MKALVNFVRMGACTMPKGPQGQKRPADVIGNAVHVMQIATGEIDETSPVDDGKDVEVQLPLIAETLIEAPFRRCAKRSNETHRSTTDPDAMLYRKGPGMEAKLCFIGHGLMENRSGLIIDTRLTRVSGHAER